jgi:hypothetical protein
MADHKLTVAKRRKEERKKDSCPSLISVAVSVTISHATVIEAVLLE